jgi:hypothetical protein
VIQGFSDGETGCRPGGIVKYNFYNMILFHDLLFNIEGARGGAVG